jgi:hypothetical protein
MNFPELAKVFIVGSNEISEQTIYSLNSQVRSEISPKSSRRASESERDCVCVCVCVCVRARS